MKETSLSERIGVHHSPLSEIPYNMLFAKDVKEKIQTAERRLKEELRKNVKDDHPRESEMEGTINIIKRIFLEEFGDKLI